MTLQGLRARVFRGGPPWLFRWNSAFVGELSQVPEVALRGERLRVRWAGPEDVELLAQVRPRRSSFAKHFGMGHRCALGFMGETPVSMNWLSRGRCHESQANRYLFDCGADGAWSTEDFVHPDHRRRGHFAKHLAGLMDLLAGEGITRLYCAMIADDRRSLGAHQRAGYRLIFRLHTARVVGVTLHRIQDLRSGRTSLAMGVWRGTGALP